MRPRPEGFRRYLLSVAIAVATAAAAWSQAAGPATSPAAGSATDPTVAALVARASEPDFARIALDAAVSRETVDGAIAMLEALAPRAAKPADRAALYSSLASLLELSGRWSDAAVAWESAATGREPVLLIKAAACRVAAGEGREAAALAAEVLAGTPEPREASLAGVIAGWASLLNGEAAKALEAALKAVDDADRAVRVPALALARAASAGDQRAAFDARLSAEFRADPGVLTIAGVAYLVAGLDPAVVPAPASPQPVTPIPTVPATPVPATPPAAPATAVEGPVAYQVGAYRDSSNAAALLERLSRAGFSGKTAKRASRGVELTIVYVLAGTDPGTILLALKDAGFEAWPLFELP